MKQMKIWMATLALLMVISLTSCLNSSENESTYDGMGYARVVMGAYFQDLAGNTYIPTSASVTTVGLNMSTADLVYIAFKYVDDTSSAATKATEGSTTTPQTHRIQLVAASAVEKGVQRIVSTEADLELVTENAPIVTLNPSDGYGNTYKPWMYGADLLVLPIAWRMEDKSETLAQHTMSLVYVQGDENESATQLTFYLRHDKGTDTKTEATAIRNKFFDVSSILANFKATHGAYPTNIVIKAKANTDGATLPESYTDFKIENIQWN